MLLSCVMLTDSYRCMGVVVFHACDTLLYHIATLENTCNS